MQHTMDLNTCSTSVPEKSLTCPLVALPGPSLPSSRPIDAASKA